ncbi:amino acid ABC transporter permease [Jiella sonneratiae]|uniref:Amino acid ABC transporter permease n=1 Tax=Jiella sonneratiae TaxID=2816856 RepID=A0ABS3J863_9HYPH|nr:amino acid ABC transporter permease [Jiella sonneratiae]MBO0905863.1 amino acid ABC transporter permease [Jiella sonneratiae]
MSLDFGLMLEKLPEILAGLWVTIWVWVVATALGAALGFLVAAARRYGPPPVDWLLRLLVEILRGTPFLVQLFLLYFGGPFVGLRLEPIPAGLIGLTVYAGAYFSEIFRAGFDAVPRGHVEAAQCVGLSRSQILRRILLPEMTMLVLPQCVNMAILLIKETAILSIITVPEMTMVIGAIGSQQYAFADAMFLLALFYWVLVEICGLLGRIAEARLSKFRFAA